LGELLVKNLVFGGVLTRWAMIGQDVFPAAFRARAVLARDVHRHKILAILALIGKSASFLEAGHGSADGG